ncbi:lysosomal alpha-glucosidase [Elysia marginata]|uniref:Lysosomal alpha-glucosidase n=1 Tax=Elysia marginata TaxID=1093978 RepID=A0AAV4HQL9_9GAST|nr:lysosomal alpha-glucosidase [Elysia marginata]
MTISQIWSDHKSGSPPYPEVSYQVLEQGSEKPLNGKPKTKRSLLEKASFVLLCLITLFVGIIMVLFGMKVITGMLNKPSEDQTMTPVTGVSADLTRTTTTLFPPDIKTLKLQINFQTASQLRVKIFDPANARFEPPVEVPKGSKFVSNPQYKVKVTESPFNIVITRASTGATVFDTTGMAPFIFADQFMQIGTRLSSQYLYGLGEHRYGFLQNLTTWRKLVFWNRDDVPRPAQKTGGITYRFTGGIFDFYILLGDSPLSVSTAYSNLIGLPYMPPFWSLGFHICKYGYKNDAEVKSVIARNRQANMPYVSNE